MLQVNALERQRMRIAVKAALFLPGRSALGIRQFATEKVDLIPHAERVNREEGVRSPEWKAQLF
jgi:hypothetical protein